MNNNITNENIYEVLKCAKDPIYFAENYYTSVSLEKGLVSGSPLYDAQKNALTIMVDNKNVVGLTARQTGMTRLGNIYALWDAIFSSNRTIGIICPKMNTAYNTMANIRLAYEQLPNWLKPGVIKMTKNEILFDNYSRIVVTSSVISFRGQTTNVLMVSDAAFLSEKTYNEISNSLYPIISSSLNNKLFVWSAPNGCNFFKRLYDTAKKHKNTWVSFLLTWDSVPGRGDDWKVKMKTCMSTESFKREFECKF